MDWLSVLRKGAVGLIGAVGIGSLTAKMVERWAERNGYLDDPSKGLHWALANIAALTDYWFFYPLLAFLVGLAIGLWTSTLLQRLRSDKERRLALLGHEMTDFVKLMRSRLDRSIDGWPNCIGDRVPELQALLYRVEDVGLPAPSQQVLFLNDDGKNLAGYMQYVGTFLLNKQSERAKEAAVHWTSEIDKAVTWHREQA